MADKTPEWSEQPLRGTERVRWKEIASNVFALIQAAVLIGESGDFFNMDLITRSMVVVPVQHHQVHEKETFSVSFIDLTVANNASIEILLRCSPTRYGHLTFVGTGGGNAEALFIEAPTVNVQGTALAENNMNRGTPFGVATVAAFHTPTVVGGAVLTDFLAPGGTGGNAAGGVARQDTEWVMNVGTDYVIRATNRAGVQQPLSIVAQWYEEATNDA